MKLLDYIRGIKKGHDANSIEKKALRDVFLYEALEGYDSVDGNHFENIKKLQKQIQSKSKQSNNSFLFARVAAIVAIVIFGLGGYMFFDFNNSKNPNTSLSAMDNRASISIINIFVPEDFYQQHKNIIKKENESNKKKLQAIKPIPFIIDDNITVEVSEQDIIELTVARNKSIIDIYVPNQEYRRNEINIAKNNNRAEIIADTTESSIEIHIPTEDYNRYKGKLKTQ